MRVIAIAYAIRNAQAGYSQANTPALFLGGCYRSRDTHPEAGYSQANTPAFALPALFR